MLYVLVGYYLMNTFTWIYDDLTSAFHSLATLLMVLTQCNSLEKKQVHGLVNKLHLLITLRPTNCCGCWADLPSEQHARWLGLVVFLIDHFYSSLFSAWPLIPFVDLFALGTWSHSSHMNNTIIRYWHTYKHYATRRASLDEFDAAVFIIFLTRHIDILVHTAYIWVR